jgi:hypothetical protein
MSVDLPSELVLLIFDAAVVEDVPTAKALRLVNRAYARRFARPVWFVGARTHYLNYLRRLDIFPRYQTLRALTPPNSRIVTSREGAELAASAALAAAPDDTHLFPMLSKCTKFRS